VARAPTHGWVRDDQKGVLRSLELLAALAMHREGLTAEQLALALYRERPELVTVRAGPRVRVHLGGRALQTSRTAC
jgi:hypothetical protein